MNKFRFLVVGLMAVLFAGSQLHAAPSDIEVTFTNRSDKDVTFFLNGGEGMKGRLKSNETSSYKMVVDKGGAPEIRIHQVKGNDEIFSLKNKGRYVLRSEGGKIVNADE